MILPDQEARKLSQARQIISVVMAGVCDDPALVAELREARQLIREVMEIPPRGLG